MNIYLFMYLVCNVCMFVLVFKKVYTLSMGKYSFWVAGRAIITVKLVSYQQILIVTYLSVIGIYRSYLMALVSDT